MTTTGLPNRMKAVLLTGHGGFEKLEYRDDLALPVAGPDDVVIRVGAAGVNNTDINTRTAWYSRAVDEATDAGASQGFSQARSDDAGWTGAAPRFPRIQGADACGTIVAVGSRVAPSRIGERILVEPVFRGAARFDAVYFGSECDGGFAEYARAPSVHAHRIVSPLSDIELASFPCAYSAAENMITRVGLAHGEHVLVTGASGGVGSAAIQLAKRRGAIVTAVAARDKADSLEALGVDFVILRDADSGAAYGQDRFDVAIDMVGGTSFGWILDGLKRGGRCGVAGAIAGPIIALDLRTLYLKDLRLFGCTTLEDQVFPNLISYIEHGEIRPIVADVYPLSQIVAAQAAFLTKRHVGKIVLIP